MGFRVFSCHHHRAHHFLMGRPVCCSQPIVCNSWVVVAHFVKHVFCCWGHHILKKNKLWGMHACNFLLACPQTSGGQTSNVHGTPCLPLLDPQCLFAPKKVTVSPGLGAPQSRLPKWPKLNILVVVPRVLQVGVLVCPALFHHVQAHSGGAAFLPFFNFSHFLAVCGQIQCFFFQWHFSDFVVPLKPAML